MKPVSFHECERYTVTVLHVCCLLKVKYNFSLIYFAVNSKQIIVTSIRSNSCVTVSSVRSEVCPRKENLVPGDPARPDPALSS